MRSLLTRRMKNMNKQYTLSSALTIHTCSAETSVRMCAPVKRVSSCPKCRLPTNITVT